LRNRQIATYDATKHRTSASLYDAIDRLISSTDTFSQNTTYTYLDAARKKLTLTPLGLLITATTDTAGNLTETIDSIHPATRYQYDKRNRKTKIIDATGGETLYTYYSDGQTKSVTDAVSNITTYLYDTAGRLIQENSPLGSRFYNYDLVNNRIQGKDRNGRITRYDYDNLNRVKSEQWVGDGRTFTYAYDRNSNLTSTQDGNIRYEYAYDNTDLLEKVDRISGTNPKVTFKYTYDEIGNLTIAEELIANVLKATTSYEYTDPRYLNTKITQTGVGLATKQVKFTYDTTGLNRKVERYLDGLLKLTTTNPYDTYGRLSGIKQENNSGAIIANDIYDLDNLNRLQAQTKDGNARAIVYDNTDQVKTVTGSNSEAYTYDLNGNRMGGGYSTIAGNRLMSDGTYSYEYDAEGNRTKRTKIADNTVDEYRWDYRNRLTQIVSKNAGGSVIKTVGYDYDVDDQRVKKTVTSATPSAGDGVENYYLDRNQIAFVTDGSGNQTFHYLYGLNVDSVMAQDSPAGMVWALADRLGSIETLTDSDGNVVNKRNFDSFGRILSETNPSVQFRYGYTGRERDLESGLDYYRARYYDPQVGRFISVDPMGFGAGDTNLYRYVGNNSTNATDPSGEWINFAIGAVIGGGLDLGMQLWENRGTDKGIDLTRLAISTISGAIGSGIGGALLKQGTGLAARTALNAGVGFNLGYYGKVIDNGVKGKELTDGALFTGIAGGVGAALGELIPVGTGRLANGITDKFVESPFWNKYGGQILKGVDKYGSPILKGIKDLSENLSIFARNRVTDARIILDPGMKFNDRVSIDQAFSLYELKNDIVNILTNARSFSNKFIADVANDTKSIIRADINIEGVPKVLKAFSGTKNFSNATIKNPKINTDQYAPFVKESNNLKAYKVDAGREARISDTEIKILEQVVELTENNPNVTGTIRMLGNRETCYSCQKVALDFRKIRPNIEIEFTYTPRETDKLKFLYNRIRNLF
jgi:RHS repeat-associated protein